MTRYLRSVFIFGTVLMVCAGLAHAQSGSTRPRRVPPQQPATTTDASKSTPSTRRDGGLLDVVPTTATANTGANTTTGTGGGGSTARAFALFQQNQYEAALQEAKRVAAIEPNNSEAWKIAGFAESNLKQYAEAASDLQRALDLQRTDGAEDANTVDALGKAYALTEDFERALPLLIKTTTRAGAKPDALMLYYRGLAEYRTGKAADAEASFNAAVKANPKDAASLYFLGRMAFEKNNIGAAIAALNRATTAEQRFAPAWALLTTAYLRRAATGTGATSDADYLSAVRAGESLTRVRSDVETNTLYAQALIGAQQYARAAAALEPFAAAPDVKGATLYLLGVSHSRAKNFPKAIAALERAATKSPDDVNIYRELGYASEVSKQYAKALAAYRKGAELAPADTDFKEAIERVSPFVK